MKAYLVKDKKRRTYFAGGIWTSANKALLFSSVKEAIETFPELQLPLENKDIEFKPINFNLT